MKALRWLWRALTAEWHPWYDAREQDRYQRRYDVERAIDTMRAQR